MQLYQAKLALHLGNSAPPAQRCLAAARLALGDLHGARSTLDSLKTSTMPQDMKPQVAKVHLSRCNLTAIDRGCPSQAVAQGAKLYQGGSESVLCEQGRLITC